MIVLDASVWVSTLRTADVNHVVSRRWIAVWTGAGNRVFVPRLFLAEVAGAVARTSASPAIGRKAIADIASNPAMQLVPLDDTLVDLASRYAADLLLRGSDAVYVALADRLKIPLVTWDKEQLARAAAVINVRTPTI